MTVIVVVVTLMYYRLLVVTLLYYRLLFSVGKI